MDGSTKDYLISASLLLNHKAYLKAANNSNLNLFGNSVAIDRDTIVVGSHGEDSNTHTIIYGDNLSYTNNDSEGNGAVYIFR